MGKVACKYDLIWEEDEDRDEGNILVNEKLYNTIEENDFYNICYIRLKGDKYILCLVDRYFNKVIPDKSKIKNRLTDTKLTNEMIKKYSKYRQDIYHSTKQKANGKYAIINDTDLPIGIEGDTIVSHSDYVAVYQKDKSNYDLYDGYLNKKEHNYNIRYVKPFSRSNMLVLISNNMHWFKDGKITNEVNHYIESYSVCGTVSRYIDQIVYDGRGKISLKKTKDHRMVARGMEYFDFDIINAQNIDSLYFYNMKI